jgi:DNA-binding NtrC family response regulator
MNRSAHLVLLGPGASARTVPLDAPVITVGRDPSCDLRIDQPDVHPIHAELRWRDARVEIVRHGSVLWINGRRVRQHTLSADDLVVIGRTALVFRWGTGTEPAEAGATAAQICERLYAIARRIQSDDAASSIRRQLLTDLCALTGAESACCAWLDAAGAPSSIEAFRDADQGELALSRSVIARILDTRRALLWLDGAGADLLDCARSLEQAAIRSVLAVPVWDRDRPSAVLYLASKRAAAFDRHTMDLVTLFASLVQHLLAAQAERQSLEQRAEVARSELDTRRRNVLVGNCAAMRQLDREMSRIARSELAVLILGETGTGKELVAQQLHQRSARRDGPFVAVNCSAIPGELVEATLFGHVKGAFTGAHTDQVGLIGAADRGTLFLDEVAELPLDQQAKLLRVLETREVLAVGAASPVRVDFRLVSATLRPLARSPEPDERFRQDRFFRIAGVVLRLPPLRERDDDVMVLAEHFLRRQRAELGRPGLRLSASASASLRAHAWPGNVRELAIAIARACSLTESDTLEPADLGFASSERRDLFLPLSEARDQFQKRYVLDAIERFGGNRTAAAAALGVTPRTIYKYVEEV